MRKLPFIAIIILSVIVGWQIFKPGVFQTHDDLQFMRVFEMRQCLNDGQIPCRWAPDMEFGYGQAMFNFYSAFPYYLGGLINLLGFSYVDTVKLLYWLSLAFSGIFIYLLANRYLSKTASFVTAAAYMIAPYHGVDIFVRGALSEAWAITLLPLVLYSISLMVEKPSINRVAVLALSIAAFFTTHNISTMISLPVIIIFAFLQLIFSQNKKLAFTYLIYGGAIGFGLSAFFVIPAFFEKNLINSDNLINEYFNVFIHYTTLKQLLYDLKWEYGSSVWGTSDSMSFFIGVVQVISLLVSPLILFFTHKKTNRRNLVFILFFLILSLVSTFMTHGKSWEIWKLIPILVYVQFPWRFLGLVTLGTAILTGYMVEASRNIFRPILAFIVILLLVFFNINNFHFEKYLPSFPEEEGAIVAYLIRQSWNNIDYAPTTNKVPPTVIAPKLPQVLKGDADINFFEKRSNYFATEIDVTSEESQIEFPVMYFPGWTLYLDGSASKMPTTYDNDLGLITVSLGNGHHLVQGWFESTPIRIASNIASFISALVLIGWLIVSNEKYTKK